MADTKLKILVLQGPNLNLLGTRETGFYGSETLEEIHERLRKEGAELGAELDFLQSNHEGVLVDRIHKAGEEGVDGIVLNAASLTHTSIALRDALLGTQIPYIEIHISNVHAREDFRRESYLSEHARGVVFGFGPLGYSLALRGLVEQLKRKQG